MTAPVGATVQIYVDLVERVAIDDVIQTQSGRRYRVLSVREQVRGEHVGRQHLQCVVIDREVTVRGHVATTIHQIRWYPRGRRKGRRR
jgi:hypothetical protein